jgi:hemerythrin-like domain-containing protein
MCEYCGCQELPAIAELTAEHDRLRDLGRDLGRAADRGDAAAARDAALGMLDILAIHTRVEEDALFPPMCREFAAQMEHLAEEHVSLHAVLAMLASERPEPGWAQQARAVRDVLFEHILAEQDGVFPAALSVLTPPEWDRLEEVRGRFRPRGRMEESNPGPGGIPAGR